MQYTKPGLGDYGIGRRGIGGLTMRRRPKSAGQHAAQDLAEIQGWFQRGDVQGGLWLPERRYQTTDAAGTTPVTATGDVVGRWTSADGLNYASQNTTGNKPTAQITPQSQLQWLTADATDVVPVVFPADIGRCYFTEVASQLASQTYIYTLAVFNGKLYGGTYPDGKLFEWNGSNAWVEVAPKLASQAYILTLAVFNGKLYGGTAPDGKLFEWNDSRCTIARATPTGVEFADSQTVNATWNDLIRPYQYNSAVCVLNRAPTAYERAVIERVLGRYVPITSQNILVNPGFDNGLTGWDYNYTLGSPFSVIDGKLSITTAGETAMRRQEIDLGVPGLIIILRSVSVNNFAEKLGCYTWTAENKSDTVTILSNTNATALPYLFIAMKKFSYGARCDSYTGTLTWDDFIVNVIR